MKLVVKKVSGENYCGKAAVNIFLSDRSIVCGKNKTGKTTVGNMIVDPLTGKTLTGTEIDSRPKDENGSAVDHVETRVDVDIEVDGVPYTLSKVTKQKWVKNRGESEAKFTGYSNEMYVSGIPKKQKDYEALLTELIAPADIRLKCIVPQATLALDMKKRRASLMTMAEDITDEVVIKAHPEFKELAEELRIGDPEELIVRGRKIVKTKNAELLQIPARVDALNGMKVEIDKKAVKKAEETIKDAEAKAKQSGEDLTRYNKETEAVNSAIAKARVEMENRRKEISCENMRKAEEQRLELAKMYEEANLLNGQISALEQKIKYSTTDMAREKEQIDALKAEQKEVKAQKMSARSLKCPTCGREYDKEVKSQIKEKFEKDKADKIADINSRGNKHVERFNSLKKQISQDSANLKTLQSELSKLSEEIEVAKSKAPSAGRDIDYTADETYKGLQKKADKLMQDLKDVTKNREDAFTAFRLANEIASEAKAQLAAIESKKGVNKSIDDKIDALKVSQRELGQEITNEERIIELLKQFQMAKINMVTDKVNENFDMVKWVMFKEQVNGAFAPICEPTVNGVSYYSTLNHSDKILAEVDICLGFQKASGVNLPIIIDDSESVDADRIPELDRQLIILRRTDDDDLMVEWF